MARCDERVLAQLALQLEREEPQLGRALTGFSSTDPPSRRRCWSGWLLLAAGIALMGAGIALSLGLLFAAGLIVAAIAQYRLESPLEQGRQPTG